MTTPDAPPDWPRIALDLLHRAEKARHTWRTPAHRLAASSDALTAARQTDIDNAQALDAIVARHGWPGRTQVGADGCQAAVFIALHADHDRSLQSRLLHALHQAAVRSEATRAQWAHLQDRLLVNADRPQLYGTQYAYRPAPSSGRLELLPVNEPQSLDHRRDEVGLPHHDGQVALLRHRHLHSGSLSTSTASEVAGRSAA